MTFLSVSTNKPALRILSVHHRVYKILLFDTILSSLNRPGGDTYISCFSEIHMDIISLMTFGAVPKIFPDHSFLSISTYSLRVIYPFHLRLLYLSRYTLCIHIDRSVFNHHQPR